MINRHQAGFTLIELVVFIVIVSVAVVGILSVMNNVVKSSADPMIRKQSAALADSILAEILLKEYTDPDATEVGETGRDNYDDVDDYNGKSNALFTDLPTELSTYAIGIVVDAPAALNGVSMKKVVVTVTHGAEAISMIGYRANY
jgi:MSHA pilin protein MshD